MSRRARNKQPQEPAPEWNTRIVTSGENIPLLDDLILANKTPANFTVRVCRDKEKTVIELFMIREIGGW